MREDRVSYKAAAFAYYALFALVPLLLIITFVGGFIIGEAQIQTQLVDFFTGRIGTGSGELVQSIFSEVTDSRFGVSVPVILILVFGIAVISFFTYLRNAFLDIFNVKMAGKRTRKTALLQLMTFLSAFIFVVLFALLVSVNVITQFLEDVLSGVLYESVAGFVFTGAHVGITFVITATLLTMMYRLLSCYAIKWVDALKGGIVGAGLFILLNTVLVFYFSQNTTISFFGASGAVLAFLVWVYLAGHVFFIGAEVAKLHRHHITCRAE